MNLVQLLIAGAAALFSRFFLKGHGRRWFILCASIAAIFLLQPEMPIRTLDFWLPVVTIGLAVLGWGLTSPRETVSERINWQSGGVIGGMIVLMELLRLVYWPGVLSVAPPPAMWTVGIALGVIAVMAWGITKTAQKSWWLSAGILVLLGLFVVVKTPSLSLGASVLFHGLMGQSTAASSAIDIRWFGFSYVAFRLIHTLRERQMGKLAPANLQEYLIYMLFFPAFPSGPIDRMDRFNKDLRQEPGMDADELSVGGERFVIGLFKKFVVADSLGLIALNAINAHQITSNGWTWVLLYAYALQIYFDFSGYSDIAIGLGRWMGIKLPENFNHPYLKKNLTLFWSNWHMSLTQWFRSYFFNPLTRSLRKSKLKPSITMIVLITQVSTMVLIGLWHGISWNFILWGGWHGLGLFIQNRWSEWIGQRMAGREFPVGVQKLLDGLGVVVTFNFVALGWVWFVIPDPGAAIGVFKHLLNIV